MRQIKRFILENTEKNLNWKGSDNPTRETSMARNEQDGEEKNTDEMRMKYPVSRLM